MTLVNTFLRDFRSEKEMAFTMAMISFWTVLASAAAARQRKTAMHKTIVLRMVTVNYAYLQHSV